MWVIDMADKWTLQMYIRGKKLTVNSAITETMWKSYKHKKELLYAEVQRMINEIEDFDTR